MKGGKSDGKTDNMIGMKKNAPVTKKMKEVKMESTELSDSEEESVDPTNGSNSGGNTCYPHPGGKSDVKADNMIGVKKNAPATKKTKNVKIVDPTSGSKDGGNPCYSHPGGKSDAKADNMLGVKKRSPESKKAKKVKMEAVELSDYEEEKGDPSSGYSHPCKFYAKANSMRGLRKKAPETKKAKKAAKDPNKPKRPASAFLIFLKEIGKQFKEKNRGIKSAFGRAGGDKWKQLSDAEKAPYMAEAKKRMAEFKKNKDAYNRRVAAGSAEEVESDKSTSEVDEEEESGEEEEDGDDD